MFGASRWWLIHALHRIESLRLRVDRENQQKVASDYKSKILRGEVSQLGAIYNISVACSTLLTSPSVTLDSVEES